MADPFTPKFVDLVRNYTTATGTGNIVPGAAVAGYTGVAGALVAGDKFYYCIQGIDKPAEREVGRGTMLANGSVARDPIGGSATNFTPGTKTLALVAAAEWFSRLDAAAGGASSAVVSRSALIASPATAGASLFLSEAGREGMFVFSPANLATSVSADPRQGLFVAPSTDPSGASGAWVRKYSGDIDARWFGYVADDNGATGTDNGPAIQAALTAARVIAPVGDGLWFPGPTLRLPAGRAFVGSAINLKQTIRIKGEGVGQAGGAATQLRFPVSTAGIILNTQHTRDYISEPNGASAEGSIVEGVKLKGGGGSRSDNADGIFMRGRGVVRDCQIEGFARDGIYIGAGSDGNPFPGNANNWKVENVRSTFNGRDGLRVEGTDANAGHCIGGDYSFNGEWGIRDLSFLGNHFEAPHGESNGLGVANGPAIGGVATATVAYPTAQGQRYALVYGQEAAGSVTPPGTNAAVWINLGPDNNGGVLWSSGITVRSGGAYAMRSTCQLLGAYSEGGQGPSQSLGGAIIMGGLHGAGHHGTGVYLYAKPSNPGLSTNKPLNVMQTTPDGITVEHIIGDGTNGDNRVRSFRNNSIPDYFHEKISGGAMYFNYGGTPIWRVTSPSAGGTLAAAGRNSVVPFMLQAWTLNVRAHDNPNDGRIVYYGAAPPTTGEQAQGELVFNIAPTAGSPLGWIATGGGTPGQFEYIGLVGRVGYPAGYGGAVTQAAGKSSGVTLNKPSGRITMDGASLAAGALVSFTLTNNSIAANDVVLVSIASGASADAYSAGVTAVAAGSCRVQLHNVSGAALTEAVILNFAVIKAVAA